MKNLQDYVDEEYQKAPEEAMRLYDGKTIEEVAPIIIKIKTAENLKFIRSKSKETRDSRHYHINRFQTGNYLFWKDIFDQFEVFIATNLDLGTDAINAHREQKVSETDYKFLALIKNHSRACLIAEEILCLLKAGFPDAALSRWRALHEIAAILLLLLENDQECSESYLEHDIIDHYKGLLLSQNLARNDSHKSGPSEETIAQYKKLHDDLLKRYGDQYRHPFGWASKVLELKNPQFTDIEEYSKLSHMRPQYKLASHRIHAGANGFNGMLGTQRLNENRMLRTPSHDGLAGPLDLTTRSLGQITMILLGLSPCMENMISAEVLSELLEEIEQTLLKHPSVSDEGSKSL